MENTTFPPTSAEIDVYLENARRERSKAVHDLLIWVKDLLTGHPHPHGSAKAV